MFIFCFLFFLNQTKFWKLNFRNLIDVKIKLVNVEQKSFKQFQLNEEAKHIVSHGSHEAVVFNLIPDTGIAQTKLLDSSPNAKLGFAKAMSNGWVEVDKKNPDGPIVMKKVFK